MIGFMIMPILITNDESKQIKEQEDDTYIVETIESSKMLIAASEPVIEKISEQNQIENITQEMQNWLDKEDQVDIFFSNIDESKQYIKDIVSQNVKIGIEVENPNEILLHKIFCGDDGDCVPSFYSWIHNGKSVRITPAKERKIRETLGIKTIADLIQAKDNLKPLIESVAKKDVNDININERLHRQRTLVELNSSLFPKDIQSYKDTVDYMIQSTGESVFANMKAVNILKGSEYENSNKPKALTASVFKDMEKYGLTAIPIF